MSAILKFLLATIVLANLTFAEHPLPPSAALPSQQGLARLFFSSRITKQDPYVSMACFADYIRTSNGIGDTYGQVYKGCLVKATDARGHVDTESLKERNDIEAATMEVSTSMHACNELNSTLDMFNCHANAGANTTKATYTISGNASEFASLLQERYRSIDLSQDKCCHGAERIYVSDTANNYNYLQDCLDGRVEPRTTSTTSSTTTTTTTTTTTEAPTTTTTTTEAPTTMSPQGIQEQFAQLLNLLN